jgi:hypothetical protein
MKTEFSLQIFKKYSNIKFHENLCGEIQVAACGRTDMTELTVAFSNFTNAPKNSPSFYINCGEFLS